MITEINLGNLHCFGDGIAISEMKSNTFIFGANGSGKTSITRLFESKAGEASLGSGTIRVFNSDYQRRTFAESDVPGVFLLGEDSKEKLEQANLARENLSKQQQGLEKATRDLSSAKAELERHEESFTEQLWALKQAVPDDLQSIWSGSKQRSSLKEKTLSIYGEYRESDWEDLLKRYSILSGSDLESIPNLPAFQNDFGIVADLLNSLRTPIIASSDSSLLSFYRQFNLIEWAELGHQHLEQIESEDGTSSCPFCTQEIDQRLKLQIKACFDTSFKMQKAKLDSLSQNLEVLQEELSDYFEIAFNLIKSNSEGDRAERVRRQLSDSLGELQDKVVVKKQKLSESVNTSFPPSLIEDFRKLIEDAQQSIEGKKTYLRDEA